VAFIYRFDCNLFQIAFYRGLSGPNRPKVLSMMGCFGGESSIFMCRNPGWKKGIPSSCSRPNRDAGVFCYNNGRKLLDNGKTSTIYLTILKKT
jgi:hypothetical protein